jgi:NAD(P)-dependent dehydrogenase (short-subunit alcohol dehydrogenase family)
MTISVDEPTAAAPVALVVGAACPPGIGRASAIRLARRGCRVVCVERVIDVPADEPLPDTACTRPADLAATLDAVRAAAGPGGETRVVAAALDVATPGGGEAAVAAALDAFGRIDLVAHVEGGLGASFGAGPLLDVTAAQWSACLAMNLTAAFEVATAAARRMVAQGDGGSIVLLSSHAVPGLPRPGNGTFGAAKAAVERLVRDLADEVASASVRVNAVRPLGVDPAASGGGNPHLSKLVGGTGAAGVNASGRFQHPDETAAVIDFLLSSAASFVTGESIGVHGAARW